MNCVQTKKNQYLIESLVFDNNTWNGGLKLTQYLVGLSRPKSYFKQLSDVGKRIVFDFGLQEIKASIQIIKIRRLWYDKNIYVGI